jgi:hypothetical protein
MACRPPQFSPQLHQIAIMPGPNKLPIELDILRSPQMSLLHQHNVKCSGCIGVVSRRLRRLQELSPNLREPPGALTKHLGASGRHGPSFEHRKTVRIAFRLCPSFTGVKANLQISRRDPILKVGRTFRLSGGFRCVFSFHADRLSHCHDFQHSRRLAFSQIGFPAFAKTRLPACFRACFRFTSTSILS